MSKMSSVFLLLDQGYDDLFIMASLDISEEYLDYCVECWTQETSKEIENV